MPWTCRLRHFSVHNGLGAKETFSKRNYRPRVVRVLWFSRRRAEGPLSPAPLVLPGTRRFPVSPSSVRLVPAAPGFPTAVLAPRGFPNQRCFPQSGCRSRVPQTRSGERPCGWCGFIPHGWASAGCLRFEGSAL